MASIYPALQSLAVDCQKLYYGSDQDNVSAKLHRISSVAFRGLGTLIMASKALDAYYKWDNLPYVLLMGAIGHEIFAMGSSLGEQADRLSGEASFLDHATAKASKAWNFFTALPTGKAEMTASYKELLKYTWVLKHIYDAHTDAINEFFSRFTKP